MSIPQGLSLEELNVELETMHTIARALAGVRDPATRLRILRWTNERFAGLPAAPAAKPATVGQQLAPDPSLSVAGVHLFEDDGIVEMAMQEPLAPVAAAEAADTPPDS